MQKKPKTNCDYLNNVSTVFLLSSEQTTSCLLEWKKETKPLNSGA